MEPSEETPQLGGALQERVLQRLGFPKAPRPELDGLKAVYHAWCQNVPFDNVRKMIALRTQCERPLPGGDASDFFESWLSDGAGGTCWPTSNALYELLRSVGFAARRIAGYMRDLGILNHASTEVSIGEERWLVDSSLLSDVPLPLGRELHVSDDPVFQAEIEFENSTHVVWSHTPPNSTYLPCRLIEDSYSYESYLEYYEESRVRSPFNQRLYVRQNRPGEILVLLGNTRYSKTSAGFDSRTLSPDEVCAALVSDIGLSDRIVGAWVRSGSLADSLEPPSGSKPPPATRKPPSQRPSSL